MDNHRVVYDSEEDDDGLSPLNSPARSDAPNGSTTEDGNDPPRTGPQTGSTDLDFFQQVYDKQVHAAQQKAGSGAVADAIWRTQAQEGFSDGQKSPGPKPKDNSSSITDPTLKSVKKGKGPLGKVDTKALGSLTQVTTPSAPSARKKDVYDFTPSDEEGAPAATAVPRPRWKTERPASKRKREQTADVDGATVVFTPELSAGNNALDDEGGSPRQSRKKRKTAQERGSREAPDDVDLLIMPATADMSQPYNATGTGYDGPDGMVPDTFAMPQASNQNPSASIFIPPPDTLTSSQKQEYPRVRGCSQPDGEGHGQQASLPEPQQPETQGGLIPTSATLSTIVYTTPSRYASSVAPLPLLDNADGRSSNVATSSATRTHFDKTHISTSSPDELSTDVTGWQDREKRPMSDVQKDVEPAQNDSWDFDGIGHSRETYVPRPSRRRSGADHDSVAGTQPDAGNSAAKNKRQQSEQGDNTHEDPSDPDGVRLPRERYAPRPSKRRSRVVVEDEEDEGVQHEEQTMPDTCPPDNVINEWADADTIPDPPGQQLPQQPNDDIEYVEGIDLEYWAGLPEDIRRELREQYAPQALRTRRSGRAGGASSSLRAVEEATPQPKKRGRKKKEQVTEEAFVAFEGPGDVLEEQAAVHLSPAPTATAKRKRGRPKKTVPVPPPAAMEDDEIAPAGEIQMAHSEAAEGPAATDGLADKLPQEDVGPPQQPKAPTKKGRKKEVLEEPQAPQIDPEEDVPMESRGKAAAPTPSPIPTVEAEDRPPLRDISNMASNAPAGGTDDIDDTVMKKAEKQREVTPEPQAKEVPKSAAAPGQQGKAPLRVGLSKKSKIPSLLKIIRK